jgi:hypothetical protein
MIAGYCHRIGNIIKSGQNLTVIGVQTGDSEREHCSQHGKILMNPIQHKG